MTFHRGVVTSGPASVLAFDAAIPTYRLFGREPQWDLHGWTLQPRKLRHPVEGNGVFTASHHELAFVAAVCPLHGLVDLLELALSLSYTAFQPNVHV